MNRGNSTLAELVENAPLHRRAWNPDKDRGPFVVTGPPSAWDSLASQIDACGEQIVAFHDRFLKRRRLWFRGKPILPLRVPLFKQAQWLFAGPPVKRFFDGAPSSLASCLWHVPLTGWRQETRHNPDFFSKFRDSLEEIFGHLRDDASKQTFASIVRARVEGDAGFHRISTFAEYQHPVVRARPGDVVIDAGAFRGETAIRFAWSMRGRGTIVSLEPNPQNFRTLSRRRIPGLRPLPLGAWHEKATLSFGGEGGSGRIDDSGSETIEVDRIDQIVRDVELPRVDLLKFDIEGAEREGLAGARETIHRWRPKLQVSIYHKPRDVYTLPLQVMREAPNYHWYVGHHSPWTSETDLYGIPSERVQ